MRSGQPATVTGPRTGWSIICIMPRACRSGSCSSSSVLNTAPQGTPAPAMTSVTSCLVRFEVHSVIAASTAAWFLAAGGPVGHARIVEQVLATDRAHQTAPMVLVAPRAEDVAPVVEPTRRALVETAWRRADDAIAAARQQIVARGLPAHGRAAVVQHRIAHGDLDVLAAAGCHALIEGGEDAHGAQHARARIADRRARPDGRPSGKPLTPIVPPIAWAIMSKHK